MAFILCRCVIVAQQLPHDCPGHPVPGGAPAWITEELIAHTVKVWQPYYAKPLSACDALEILMNVGAVLNAVRDEVPPSDPSRSP